MAKEESHGVLPPPTAYIEKSSGRWVRRDGLWAHPSRFDSRGWRSPSPLSGVRSRVIATDPWPIRSHATLGWGSSLGRPRFPVATAVRRELHRSGEHPVPRPREDCRAQVSAEVSLGEK